MMQNLKEQKTQKVFNKNQFHKLQNLRKKLRKNWLLLNSLIKKINRTLVNNYKF